jgi:enoyl-CoA hydratase
MDYQILKIEVSEHIAVVTISRPSALNALNSDFFKEFNHFLDDLNSREDVRVLIITGEGKSFVAGADIAEMSGMNSRQSLEFSQSGQQALNRLAALPFPVIAAVNGFALGGGCELAMACDFRIASKTAKFGQPEMTLGLIPGYAGTQRLSRLTNIGMALWLILTGETISAEDALRIGLVQKLTDPEILMEETMKMARKIASNGSHAVRVARNVICKGSYMDFREACKFEAEEFSKLFDKPVTHEGMKAFLEKRKPNW